MYNLFRYTKKHNITHGLVDIGSIGFLHIANNLLGGRIDRGESLAGDGIDKLVVDEQLRFEFGNFQRHGLVALLVALMMRMEAWVLAA